jgi:methionine biosynthesis protein MetW
MSVNYTLKLLERDTQARKHIIDELLLVKSKYNIQKCEILELGCGIGQNLLLFAEDNSVKGIEGLTDAVETAKSLGLNIIQADLEQKLNFPNSSQDWIMCLDVLEHLMNPFHLMLEIKRVLKPNGRVILNVPNHLELRGRIKILLGSGIDVHNFFPEYKEWNNPHVRFFTHSGYKDMIESSGFSIIDDRSYRFNSLPLSRYFNKLSLTKILLEFLVKKHPSLLSYGFFAVLEKVNYDSTL